MALRNGRGGGVKGIGDQKKTCENCGSALADPDPEFLSTRIQIQGFDDQNWKKINLTKNFIFIFFQFQFTYPKASTKEVQATREVFISRKITFSITKLVISSLLWEIFTLLDSDPNPADQNECGSGSTTLEKLHKNDCTRYIFPVDKLRIFPLQGIKEPIKML
jgi:hypothetical protein